jgi:bifunctional UDP-N-acetylglucosamine pyrophosphorylase / glucosamine-1-phosphate N-acetyltransferase
VHPFTLLEGATTAAEGAQLGPHARIVDSTIGEEATVSYSVVVGATVGAEASVGPFASLRRGTVLGRGARLGTFVEAKATTLGEGSKAPHLSYLGDAEIGAGVNVGAGTITCNWDGHSKHKTVIEDEAYISSDTMLVAPTRIGRRAATGAGAVVRGDVPDDALAVGVPARIIEGKGARMRAPRADDGPQTTAARDPAQENWYGGPPGLGTRRRATRAGHAKGTQGAAPDVQEDDDLLGDGQPSSGRGDRNASRHEAG